MSAPVEPMLAPEAAPAPAKNTFGLVGMILAIVGFIVAFTGPAALLAWLFTLPAVVLSIIGITRRGKAKTTSLAGIIISSVGFIISIVVFAIFASTLPHASKALSAGPLPSAPTASAPATPSAAPTPTPTPKPTPSATADDSAYGIYPADEAKFVSILDAATTDLDTTTNSLKEASIVSKRDAALCRVLGDHVAKNWVGTIHDIGANGQGYGYVEIEISPTVVIETWNNAFSDSSSHTLIKPSAKFFTRLSDMEVDDKVVFTARLLSSSKSCLDGANITRTFYGIDPNFIARFSNIAKQ